MVTMAPGSRLFAAVTVRVVLDAESAVTVRLCVRFSPCTGLVSGLYRTAMPTSLVVVVPVEAVRNVKFVEVAETIVTTTLLNLAERVCLLPRNVTC